MRGSAEPWGRIATFAIGLFALLAGQFAGIAALTGSYGLDLQRVPDLSELGGAIVLFMYLSAPIQVALLVLAASYKGSAAEYLGYKLPRRGEIIFGVLVLALMIAIGDAISWIAGRSVVDGFQTDIYQAAKSVDQLPLLLFAIVVLIPVAEETLFRGFLVRGWLRSPRSAWPTILLTAALFAVVHVQYDWFLIGQVFAFGVLFGWTRWASGSTVLPILLHAMVNLEGMVETYLNT
ncbi:MAG TPA: CPBP family intramembrane glutamic endopeptidase [Pseudolabrys sp.]|nr:CPBP family intramembrane glutamic endopeptidase [Pseudolabrys sp.]